MTSGTADQTLENFVGGERRAANGAEVDLVNPSTGEVYGRAPISAAEDVDAACDAASAAFAEWGQKTPGDRQTALLKIADSVSAKADTLAEAEIRNTGKPGGIVQMIEVQMLADLLRFFAGAARHQPGLASGEYAERHTSTIRREPLGVVGCILPWNYPMLFTVSKSAQALAAGNTVVLKPAENTPDTALMLAEIFQEHLPAGTFNVVAGDRDTGRALVRNKNVAHILFTGSTRGGIEVASEAAQNVTQVTMELGGNAPTVIFDDANLDIAIDSITMSAFVNSGQDCTASTRLIVQDSVYDEFATRFSDHASHVPYGAPDVAEALFGPIISETQINRIDQLVSGSNGGAEVLTGGKRDDRPGYFYPPTVVAGVEQDDALVQEEVFGPVLTVQRFSDEEEGLRLANGVDAGLASSVFTSNHGRALRASKALDFGAVWINTHHHVLPVDMPHGGFKASGYGKDLSYYSVEELSRIKHVISNLDA